MLIDDFDHFLLILNSSLMKLKVFSLTLVDNMDNEGYPYEENVKITYFSALNTDCIKDWKGDGNCDSVNNHI